MKIKNILFIIGMILLLAGNASAGNVSEGAGASLLDTQVNNMDPSIQPYARFVSDNIVSIFIFIGGVSLLYYGAMSAAEKKKGHSQQAADHKNNTIEAAKQLGIALILFGIFAAIVKSPTFGLV